MIGICLCYNITTTNNTAVNNHICRITMTTTETSAGDIQYWFDKWERGDTAWHLHDVNSWLRDNVRILTGGKEHIKVFIPLCGKCVEIKWLSDMGHTVVGVDACPTALRQCFAEMNLTYTVVSIPECNGSLYKSSDGNIRLYCCSIFDFTNTIEGTFDAVWDRAAMVALPPELMKKYHAVMEPLMGNECQYILEKFDYANPGIQNVPHLIPLKIIQNNFGPHYKVEILDRMQSEYFREKFEASYVIIEIVRITKKSQ